MGPYTSECVDLEFESDYLISVRLMLSYSHFRSDMADIGHENCQDRSERAFPYATATHQKFRGDYDKFRVQGES